MPKVNLVKMNAAEITALLKEQAALAAAGKQLRVQANGYKVKVDALGAVFTKTAATLAKIDD
jgi:hypothetical protein